MLSPVSEGCRCRRPEPPRIFITNPRGEFAGEQSPADPEKRGVRVHLSPEHGARSRDYLHAHTWSSVGGTLLVQADETVAEYPPGAWVGVEDIYEETA